MVGAVQVSVAVPSVLVEGADPEEPLLLDDVGPEEPVLPEGGVDAEEPPVETDEELLGELEVPEVVVPEVTVELGGVLDALAKGELEPASEPPPQPERTSIATARPPSVFSGPKEASSPGWASERLGWRFRREATIRQRQPLPRSKRGASRSTPVWIQCVGQFCSTSMLDSPGHSVSEWRPVLSSELR